MAPNLFRLLLVVVALYAFLRGGREERAAAALCLIAAISTTLLLAPLQQRFSVIEINVFAVDTALFIGFVTIALRSERFWPLWISGLQLTTILGHAMKGLEGDLLPKAYAAALNFWAYPIVLILGIATWRSHHRRREQEPLLR
jgi:hypothetical protein